MKRAPNFLTVLFRNWTQSDVIECLGEVKSSLNFSFDWDFFILSFDGCGLILSTLFLLVKTIFLNFFLHDRRRGCPRT